MEYISKNSWSIYGIQTILIWQVLNDTLLTVDINMKMYSINKRAWELVSMNVTIILHHLLINEYCKEIIS